MNTSRQFAFQALLLFCSVSGFASDKSGVSPNTISLPKGPGAIEGLGESFQPTLNTGTAKYSVALKLPPGTAGHQPDIQLSYDGGSANGPLGLGWELPLAYVQRRADQGIPTYGTNFGFARTDTLINEAKEELVPQSSGFYFCENEGAFIRYRFVPATSPATDGNGGYWEATQPDGTRLEFGLSAAARIEDAATGRVFQWLLEKETDTRGNTIVYSYRSFPGEQNQNQKFLTGIHYGPGAPPWQNFHAVLFAYEDRLDWFEDCRSGFVVRTGKRLRSVIVATQGPTLQGHLAGDWNGDGVSDNLVRRYDLGYLNYAGTNSHWSLLSRIQQIGDNGTDALPPLTFGYTVSNPPDVVSAANHEIGGENEPDFVMDQADVDLVDLNGDGLPDVLKTSPFGGDHIGFLNQGEVREADRRVIRWQPGVALESADRMFEFRNVALSEDTAHLADMNGDGRADLVFQPVSGPPYYFSNGANFSWGPRTELSTQLPGPPAPFAHSDVRTADVDFDKRIDIIQSVDTGLGADYRVWFNLGSNTYSESITIPQATGFPFSDRSVYVVDFNGDRVPDILRLTPTELRVMAGLGYGQFALVVTVSVPDALLDSTQIARAQLTDVTGDGLADLVIERAESLAGELWYWINLGNYTFSPLKKVTDMPVGISPNATIRWADFNGNGTTDLIYSDSLLSPRMRTVDVGEFLNGDSAPNLLVAISNGLGRVTQIGYSPSTKFALEDSVAGRPWTDPMPFPVNVVTCVTNFDSLGHHYVTEFHYHNGYYDPQEKQFRGFAQVEQVEIGDSSAPTLITRSRFDTGKTFEPMKGKLLRLSAEQIDGRVFWEESNQWTVPPRILMTGTNGQAVRYVHPMAKVKVISELGQGVPRRLESDFAYDEFGNETTNADYGIVEGGDRSAFDDERITTTEYALNLEKWIVHLPKRQKIQDENGAVLSSSESYYDDETFSGKNLGAVTIGNLTLRRDWINATDTIRSARSRYDAYGNPTMLLDPLGAVKDGAVDFSQGHAREIEYDPRFHAYPTREIIHVGNGGPPLELQVTYNEGFAAVLSSRDFNANSTTYGHDAFGRLIRIVKPGDTAEYPTVEYFYSLAENIALPGGGVGIINHLETWQLDRAPGSSGAVKRDHYHIARSFVDGLGRTLMTKAEAEPESPGGPGRVVVNGAVRFNARLKPARALNPFFSRQGGSLDERLAFENIETHGWTGLFHENGRSVPLDLEAAHQTATTYDATLRELEVVNPDRTTRRVTHEALLTRSYDENDTDPDSPHFNTPLIHNQDGLGRLIRVDEITRVQDDGTPGAELQTWTTRYEYDLNDQLTRIRDSQGNEKWFRYDGLKRKVFMNDPDRGAMQFAYDDASNLVGTTDAKGQRLTFTYDGANRILTEDYHDEGSAEFAYGRSPDVAYHYDRPYADLDQGDNTLATAQNVRGKLAWVDDATGEEHSSFDPRGRALWTVKRILDPQYSPRSTRGDADRGAAPLISYRTAFEFDSLDRVTRLTYPDYDRIEYEYNERSLLKRISGGPNGSVISSIHYHPSGQLRQIDYGNGVRTSHGYDPRQRLTRLHTRRISPPEGGEEIDLIHFSYAFDPVSNIEQITDQRPGKVVPAGDPRRNTQVFGYDDLYRLTRVQYSFNLPSAPARNDGEIHYRYDRIGNMLAQVSTLDNREKGLPIADLGEMQSGGLAGRWNRLGRQAGDPPGPHALTQIQKSQSPMLIRDYPYDLNGNMTDIDGLKCTWDFKDRLVRVENDEMVADYRYDYADRRILKRVVPKTATSAEQEAGGSGITTVTYVNKFFEVREQDAPTKYVWNGETRVAQVTGTLTPGMRIQRLRLLRGWNLYALAVAGRISLTAGEDPVGAASPAAFQWNPVIRGWDPVTSLTPLPAGTVLWIHTTTNRTLSVIGVYPEPVNQFVDSGGGFFPGPGLQAWTPKLRDDISSVQAVFSTLNSGNSAWSFRLDLGLATLSPIPGTLSSSEPIFIRTDTSTELVAPDPTLQIRWYHHDHLGSSACLSDAGGGLVEETVFYPFGQVRHTFLRRGSSEDYRFTQKEQDKESSLHYVEARFLGSTLGRFVRTDPMVVALDQDWLENPQGLNSYAYCQNRPMNFTDPSGMREKPKADKDEERTTLKDTAQGMRQILVEEVVDGALEKLVEYVGRLRVSQRTAIRKAANSLRKSAERLVSKRKVLKEATKKLPALAKAGKALSYTKTAIPVLTAVPDVITAVTSENPVERIDALVGVSTTVYGLSTGNPYVIAFELAYEYNKLLSDSPTLGEYTFERAYRAYNNARANAARQK